MRSELNAPSAGSGYNTEQSETEADNSKPEHTVINIDSDTYRVSVLPTQAPLTNNAYSWTGAFLFPIIKVRDFFLHWYQSGSFSMALSRRSPAASQASASQVPRSVTQSVIISVPTSTTPTSSQNLTSATGTDLHDKQPLSNDDSEDEFFDAKEHQSADERTDFNQSKSLKSILKIKCSSLAFRQADPTSQTTTVDDMAELERIKKAYLSALTALETEQQRIDLKALMQLYHSGFDDQALRTAHDAAASLTPALPSYIKKVEATLGIKSVPLQTYQRVRREVFGIIQAKAELAQRNFQHLTQKVKSLINNSSLDNWKNEPREKWEKHPPDRLDANSAFQCTLEANIRALNELVSDSISTKIYSVEHPFMKRNHTLKERKLMMAVYREEILLNPQCWHSIDGAEHLTNKQTKTTKVSFAPKASPQDKTYVEEQDPTGDSHFIRQYNREYCEKNLNKASKIKA